ncbi:hypothetical protein [Sphingomonas sp.]
MFKILILAAQNRVSDARSFWRDGAAYKSFLSIYSSKRR